MKKLQNLFYSFWIAVIFLSNGAMYGQQKLDTFYLETKIDNNFGFVFSALEVLKKIHIYEDGFFDLEVFSLGIILKFSSGQWQKINDSAIYLKSDKKNFDSVFKRNKRQRDKEGYKFISFSDYYLKLDPQNKYAILFKHY